MAKKVEEEKKKRDSINKKEDVKRLKNINKLIDYYNKYENEDCSKETIEETKKELFLRVFGKEEVESINEDMELVLPKNKTSKIKDFESFEEIENVLEGSKDAFSFLVYSKNSKPSLAVDIIGAIVLSILAIGIICAGKVVFGIIFILCFVALYYVTFTRDRK